MGSSLHLVYGKFRLEVGRRTDKSALEVRHVCIHRKDIPINGRAL